MKKTTIVIMTFIISMFFFVGFLVLFNDSDSSLVQEARQGIPDVNSPGIEWNGTELFDSTVYYPENNTCYGSRYGMTIDISPCVSQSPLGKDVKQYVDFTWNGGSPRNTSWVFVYDGQIEKGTMDVLVNKSYTYIEEVHSLQWISDYLVDKVVTYTDLGTPTSACEIGSSLNNTRMFNVTRVENGTSQYNLIYCFTDVTVVNATAFRISGWRDVYTPTEMMGYRDEWVDITDKIIYLGNGLLDDNRSYYRVQDDVEFDVGETIKTRWIYTPKDKEVKGKWHIFGHDSSKTIIESIIADEYIYLDPWWDNDWNYKKQITLNSTVASTLTDFPITFTVDTETLVSEGKMNSDCSDVRILNSTETGELEYEIETNSCNTTYTNIYVKMPSLINRTSTTDIYLYYGNALASDDQNASGVWSNGYQYVMHFGNETDSIGGITWTNNNAVAFTTRDNKRVANFTASSTQYLSIAGTSHYLYSTDTTFFMSIYPQTNTAGIFGTNTALTGSAGWVLEGGAGTNCPTQWCYGMQNNGQAKDDDLDTNTMKYFHVSKNDSNVSLFEYGQFKGNFSIGIFNDQTGRVVGRRTATAPYFSGYVDELRWSNVERTQDWMIAEINQTYEVGAEQTASGVTLVPLSPANQTITADNTINFSVNVTATGGGSSLDNTTLNVWYSNGTLASQNVTNYAGSPTNEITNWTVSLNEGSYVWSAIVFINSGENATMTNRTFEIDQTSPSIIINSPIDATQYATTSIPLNVTLNATVTEDNLDTCWYYTSDNSTNITFTCNSLTNVSFDSGGTKAIVVFANDTAGNEASNITTIEIVYYTYDIDYDDSVVEGQPKSINVTVLSDQMDTSILSILTWNGTEDTSVSKSIINTTAVLFSTTSLVPQGTGNSTGQNISFFWRIYLTDGSINFTTNTSQQTIFSLEIDNCSSLSTLLLNYTMYDEDTRALLNGTNLSGNIQLDVEVTSILNSSQTVNLSREYANTENALVCISSIDTGFRVDAQARYTADDYVVEYHNIQNATLSASNFPQNISLYLLDSLSSQEFLITVKDTAFVPIADALVEITREYLPLGQFLTVEIPKTDYDGRTIGHFVLNDEVYTIYVKKNGVLIAVFENVRAFCSDVSTGDCRINLNAGSVGAQTKKFETEQNVSFTQTYNDTTKVYKVTFTTTDSSIKTINITVKKFDVFLNDTICSDSISSSSGSLTCTIPAGYYNNTVIAAVYVDDVQVSSNIFDVTLTKTQLNNIRWLFAFILVMTLPLLAITSAPMALIFFIIGVIAAGALALVDLGGYVGAFSAFLWLIIAALILIWKATRPKEVLG